MKIGPAVVFHSGGYLGGSPGSPLVPTQIQNLVEICCSSTRCRVNSLRQAGLRGLTKNVAYKYVPVGVMTRGDEATRTLNFIHFSTRQFAGTFAIQYPIRHDFSPCQPEVLRPTIGTTNGTKSIAVRLLFIGIEVTVIGVKRVTASGFYFSGDLCALNLIEFFNR